MRAPLNIGFLPLTDAAPLIAAVDFGFAQAEGLAINLLFPVRTCETNLWA